MKLVDCKRKVDDCAKKSNNCKRDTTTTKKKTRENALETDITTDRERCGRKTIAKGLGEDGCEREWADKSEAAEREAASMESAPGCETADHELKAPESEAEMNILEAAARAAGNETQT